MALLREWHEKHPRCPPLTTPMATLCVESEDAFEKLKLGKSFRLTLLMLPQDKPWVEDASMVIAARSSEAYWELSRQSKIFQQK